MQERFLVAHNPDPDSRLPYLLHLPIDGGLVLKAKEAWPTTVRVFCHQTDEPWPRTPTWSTTSRCVPAGAAA